MVFFFYVWLFKKTNEIPRRQGTAEVEFYRRVAAAVGNGDDASTSFAGFAPYVPAYRGTFRVDAAGIVAVAGDDPTAAAARSGRVGTFHHVIVERQNTVQLMTASMIHVTNLTPGSVTTLVGRLVTNTCN
jgi:hypothetical protein